MYYIGTDKSLYRLTSQNYVWRLWDTQSSDYWPVADEPNAELSVVSAKIEDTGIAKTCIYYLVDGKLVEVALNGNDNDWKKWRAVPEWDFNSSVQLPTGATTTTSSSPNDPTASTDADSTTAESESDSDGGLSSGAKIGLGVGVGLGVVALGAIMAAVLLFRRNKKKNAAAAASAEEDGTTVVGSEVSTTTEPYAGWDQKMAPGSGGYTNVQQLDATERPMELDAPRVVHEMPVQNYSHELSADGPNTMTTGRVEAPEDYGLHGTNSQGQLGEKRV